MGSRQHLMFICILGFLLWEAEARIFEFRLLKSTDTSDGETPAPSATPDAETPAPSATPTTTSASGNDPQGTVFDVTKYGAKGDGKTDNNKAFVDAWAAACKSTEPSTLVVPKGDYSLTSIKFSGPCGNKKSPRVEINGKLIAPTTAASDDAWITFTGLSGLNITGVGTGSLDGQGEATWSKSCVHTANSNCKMAPTSLHISSITGGSLSDITIINSKAFHVVVGQSTDFTVHDVKIQAPGTSRNTDGVHIGDSSSITVANSEIGTGDDCVSIGAGTSNIVVSNVTCGPGHGISLGSLGKYENEKPVKGLRVQNCSFTETDNGVRIKTWPASADNTVSDVIFEDIVMTNVKNPIIVTQEYCDKSQCGTTPSRVKLTDIHFKNIRGTSATKDAVIIKCSKAVPCETVELVDINLKSTLAGGATTSNCTNAKGVASGVQMPTSCF